MSDAPPGAWRPTVTLWVLLGAFVILMASIVIGALRRPALAVGDVTPAYPSSIGDTLVGPADYTVDATNSERWIFFDFSRNAAVGDPGPLDWDIAIRRFEIIVNGGPGFAGRGGIADLGRIAFDSVMLVPDTGYGQSTRDSTTPTIRHWYDYGYTSHLLVPNGHTFAVRTADGKYARIAIVSYYCAAARSGCLTFRYAYQGNGGRRVVP